MNKKKILMLKYKAVIRTKEAIINVQSYNYPKLAELALIANIGNNFDVTLRGIACQRNANTNVTNKGIT